VTKSGSPAGLRPLPNLSAALGCGAGTALEEEELEDGEALSEILH